MVPSFMHERSMDGRSAGGHELFGPMLYSRSSGP
jgi:hypothetical protein